MKRKLKKLITTLSLAASAVIPQMIGLPYQEVQKAEAHCPLFGDPLHCASHIDPTKDGDGDGCADTDITCNPHLKPVTKEASEKAWGEAGSVGYKAAAATMRGRHGSSVGLDDIQKKYLRPNYGSLVDQVVVVYNARMMNEWTALGYKIPLGGVASAAQTYCNRIYIKDSYQKDNRDQLLLLAHELRHSQQCQELGGEGKFGYHYFREYKRAGLNYENNALEKSAEEHADTIANSIPKGLITAPVTGMPISVNIGNTLFYDRDNGVCAFTASDGSVIQRVTSCRRTWHSIVYTANTLLFYDRDAGQIETYKVGSQGLGGRLHRYAPGSIRKTWVQITSPSEGIIVFKEDGGYVETYRLNSIGMLQGL